jgi:glycosyltransferase involved in cell wall biosynthesis
MRFDLVHHVTFVKYWAPSFMPLLPLPFVWGPVGGGDVTPPALWRGLSWRGKLYETFRELARWLGEHDPFVRFAARHSALALAVTPRTAERLRRLGAPRVEMFPQCGLNDEEIRRLGSLVMPPAEPVRFLSVGQLLHHKGFDLGLRAFHRANIPGARYWIVGEGPERSRLRDLARNLGISRQVRFLGQLSREDALDRIGRCHILVHPSLHDSGGWVRACGCP